MDRRDFNSMLLLSAAALAAAKSHAASSSECSPAPGANGLTAEDVRDYVDAFNRNDFPGFSKYYLDNVTFQGRGRNFKSSAEVIDFYRMVKQRMRETLTIRNIVVGPRDIAMELETELLALQDWPDFFGGAIKKGELRRTHNFIWYETEGRKFKHIRSARYQPLEGPSVHPPQHKISQDATGACVSRATLTTYIDAFNRGDNAVYGKYYADDVVLVVAGERELRGKQAIFDFYKGVKSQTQRTIQINKTISTPNRLAAELQSEFLALQDVPDMVGGGPLKKGARRFINTFVFYDLRDGKFARLRSATFNRIDKPPA
jgi:ketosteroid isomerase-like protein